MNEWRPVIAVVGAGAVGGYYGGRLAQHGHEVHFLLRGDWRAVAEKGWVIKSCRGDFSLSPQQVRVYQDPAAMPRADLVIIATKATANHELPRLVAPLVGPDTTILTLQNGLGNEEQLAGLFGPERILGGLCFVCINRIGPGLIHHIDYGLVRIGAHVPKQKRVAARVVELLAGAGIECELLEDLAHGRWEKLVWNIPFNGLGAVLGVSTDVLVSNVAGLELVGGLMAEVLAAARGVGVQLPVNMPELKIQQTQRMGAYKSSMQIDRELGRPMEVEAILGEPVRAAERAGVRVPQLRMLYHLAQLVSLGKVGPAR
jgi:2-dehydropantoate 2-reductase